MTRRKLRPMLLVFRNFNSHLVRLLRLSSCSGVHTLARPGEALGSFSFPIIDRLSLSAHENESLQRPV
jgi:hypothetical protein